ncbi:MAG: molybdopterin-synthase adenylyltransferase MoeB [Porticoccaceae bacterium]
MNKVLSRAQQSRYGRQLLLPQFGFDGQETLSTSTALIVGLGGLGCAAAQYLAASGVGRLLLADFDSVELSNLQRQVLHGDADLGKNKAESAAQALAAINPHVELVPVIEKIEAVSASSGIAQFDITQVDISQVDVVVDCSDNLATRELLNEVCYQHQTPLVSGAAIRMEGQVSVFPMTPGAPCYQCLSRHFGEQELSCVEAGVLAPLVGIIGSMQALETIKVLSGVGKTLAGRILLFDGAYGEWQSFELPVWSDCPVCQSVN